MPFKNKEKAKRYAKEAMRRKRGITSKENVIPVIPRFVIPVGRLPITLHIPTPQGKRDWAKFKGSQRGD